MTGVVLRCPNCGTTGVAPGECEACHESQVRYQCTNHSPGRWLDAPACTQCGARFGGPDRPPAKPSASASTPAMPRRPPVAVPAPVAAARPRAVDSPAVRPTSGTGAPRRRERPAPTGDDAADPRDEHGSKSESWQDRLEAAARTRTMPPEVTPDIEVAPIVRGFGGCLMRLVMFAVLLFLALVSGVFVFGTSLLGGF